MKCARKRNAAAAEADFGTPRSSPHSRTTPPHPRAAHTASCRSFFLRTPLPGLLFIILLLTPIPATHKVEGSYNLVPNIYIYTYIFVITINSRVDIDMSVYLSVRIKI